MAVIERIYNGGRAKSAQRGIENPVKKIRVAAYCRVSTELERQQSSLETQMKVFNQRIREHPGWMLAGIYADEGLSGTNAAKRVEFQRMIADAEAGKIDYIITKSISRFARNTLDCIQTVRRLQSFGCQLYFEKENIDTGTAMSEMLLTVLAAFAQEESRSISENLKWGIRKRYEKGEVRWQTSRALAMRMRISTLGDLSPFSIFRMCCLAVWTAAPSSFCDRFFCWR